MNMERYSILICVRPRPDPPEEKLKAFPPGFRMITGDPLLRHNTSVSGRTDAFTYICLDYSGNSKGMKERYTEFPNRNCPRCLPSLCDIA